MTYTLGKGHEVTRCEKGPETHQKQTSFRISRDRRFTKYHFTSYFNKVVVDKLAVFYVFLWPSTRPMPAYDTFVYGISFRVSNPGNCAYLTFRVHESR